MGGGERGGGAAARSRGGQESGGAAGPGPGRAVLFTFGRAAREPGPAVPLPGGGRWCGALRPGDPRCLLALGGRERCGWIMAGTSLLVWQEGQEARRGAPPPAHGRGGTGQAGLAAPSKGKERYRAGWWECSPSWATTMTLL